MADTTGAITTPNVSSLAFWSLPATERATAFAELRRREPLSFQPPSDFGMVQTNRGFWAVTRHADVQHVSRHPEVFCSGEGVGMGAVPKDFLELNASFLVMDAPRHTELRRIVSGAFTPKQVARLQDGITTEASRIVDAFVEQGGGDVIKDLAMKLPLWTISKMMGIPDSLQADFYGAAESQLSAQDPEFSPAEGSSAQVAMAAAETLHAIARELIADRRARPGDDILSTLVQAEAGGQPLSDSMLGGIFVLFATAGNDTTRTSTSHGIRLFSENPSQWSRLSSDRSLLNTSVEEIVRCATPVIHFRRTATQDIELGSVMISEGDLVVLFYESANRDESVFESPERFDIGRDPNPHVGFGGGGAHFCLGANLARAQLRALFARLVERASSIEAGPPSYLVSNFSHGIKRMQVAVEARQGS